jgi:hypothetical protein
MEGNRGQPTNLLKVGNIMKKKNFKNKKAMLVGVGVISAAGLAGSAFAASITVPAGNAGQGTNVTSGYSAGTVSYNGGWTNTANGTGTTTVTNFEFTLNRLVNTPGGVAAADTTVYAQLIASGGNGNWVKCIIPSTGNVRCVPGGTATQLSAVTGVNIVAYNGSSATV